MFIKNLICILFSYDWYIILSFVLVCVGIFLVLFQCSDDVIMNVFKVDES